MHMTLSKIDNNTRSLGDHLGSANESIDADKLGVLLIQDKNRTGTAGFVLHIKDYECFPKGMPVLSIQVELGAEGEEKIRLIHVKSRPNLIAFQIKGCSDQTYACLSPSDVFVVWRLAGVL